LQRLAEDELRELEEVAYEIRRLTVELVAYGQWGHIGGSISMAELLAVLYWRVLDINPKDPSWEKRDRLVLSKAHTSPGLYAALALRGFYDIEAIYGYADMDGMLDGHTDPALTPGVESANGLLGLGLSVAVGMAVAMRLKEEPRQRVFCILGDGELAEGNIWEAAMFAAHAGLDNLIAIVDYNKVQAKGLVHQTLSIEPLADKFRSFGWDVRDVDGHDLDELVRTFHEVRWVHPAGRPIVVIAHTVKGRGIRMAEFNPRWHTHAPDPGTADEMLRQLAEAYGRPFVPYSRRDLAVKKEMLDV
jgi:transketolase